MTPLQQYRHGQALRKQAKQLSNRSLATKFERGLITIQRIAEGQPVRVPEDEQALIRDCMAERARLLREASELTAEKLCGGMHPRSFIRKAGALA
jgi:CTP-dependent riboflavin kinase